MDRRDEKISINLTTGHIMLIFKEPSLHLLNYFAIALILPVFIVYVNQPCCYLLFDLFLCVILSSSYSTSSHHYYCVIHLLLPWIFEHPFYHLPHSSCTCCHAQCLISSPSPPTYTPLPISSSMRLP